METSSFKSLLLTRATENALQQWLREHGLDRATIRAGIGGLAALYHLVEMRRLVLVTAAVTHDHPQCVAAGEIRGLHEHAQRLGAQAWHAHVIVRRNFQPSAIIWRSVARGGHAACAATA
jgi:hypothetical protein